MFEDGSTKDDVKLPDNEVGEKIKQLFQVEEKDTSMCLKLLRCCLRLRYSN
jgi:translation initiation factor 5A